MVDADVSTQLTLYKMTSWIERGFIRRSTGLGAEDIEIYSFLALMHL